MKLTLSSGGGVTGLRKTHSIDTKDLDVETRESLHSYLSKSPINKGRNFGEVWRLENGNFMPVEVDRLDEKLKSLYKQMSSRLSYQPYKKPS